MIGVIIPGSPIITGGPLTSTNVAIDIQNPRIINNITLFQTEALPDGTGAAIYYSTPPYESLQFIGCVCNIRPSDVFYTGWSLNPNVNMFQQIKLCVKLDKLSNLKMALEEKKDENELEEDKFIKNVEKINVYQLQHKYLFPICLLGEAGVGKTSLLTRFCDNSFKERYNNTIGVDFRVITLKYKNIISKIHIWDTAGQERFRSLALNYINNSQGFIFVYDITNRESFNNIENWVNLALEKNNKNICNFLVGNKTDKEAERKVSVKEGEILAKEKNFFFLETSAKTDDNVQKLFYYCLYRLIEYYKKHEYIENSQISLSNSNTEEISTIRQPESKCSC